MDFSNLAAFGSAVPGGYQLGQATDADIMFRRAQALKAQQQLKDEAIARAARAAAARSMYGPNSMPTGAPGMAVPGATPMPGAPAPQPMAPGQPSVPMQPPHSQVGPTPNGTPGFAPPQPQASHPGAPAPSGGFGGLGPMPPGGYDIGQLAQVIKRRNPGIDDETLFAAIQQTQALLNPEGKLQLQYMTQLLRDEEARARVDATLRGQDKATERTEIQQKGATGRTAMQQAGAGQRTEQRIGASERGQDIRASTAKRGQDITAGNKTAAQLASEATAEVEKYNKQIGDLIRENDGLVPAAGSPKRAEYDRLKALRDSAIDRKIAARKRAGGGVETKPTDFGATGTKDNPARPKTQAEYDALPKGAWFEDDEGVKQKP